MAHQKWTPQWGFNPTNTLVHQLQSSKTSCLKILISVLLFSAPILTLHRSKLARGRREHVLRRFQHRKTNETKSSRRLGNSQENGDRILRYRER